MAELATIARPYAEAVFQQAERSNALSAWSQVLARMAQVAQHAQVRACINDPKLSARQLTDLFVSLSGEGLSAEAKNFVELLVENGRLALLPEIRTLFEQSKNKREGVLQALVQSAFPMDDLQLGTLVGHLEKKYGRKVQPKLVVDKELIGGVRIVVGDEVIDASVKGKLANMQAALVS